MSTKRTANTNVTTAQSTNAIVKNLSKEEIAKSQESAVTRYASFSDSFKAIASKHSELEYLRDTNRDTYFKIDKYTSHISRKEKYIVLYTTACKTKEERDALLAQFKDTKAIHTCNTAKYLNSKENQLEIIFEAVDTVKCDEVFVKKLIDTVKKCQKMREDARKAQKAQ